MGVFDYSSPPSNSWQAGMPNGTMTGGPTMLGNMDFSSWNQAPAQNADSPFSMYGAQPVDTGAGASTGFMGNLKGYLGDSSNWSGMLSGLGSLGQAWAGFQQMGAAKDALNFQKKAFMANLVNSTKSYNNSLEDRIRGRTSDYAGKEGDVQSYLAAHKLTTG